MSEKIGVASDHAGYNLKEKILEFLKEKGYETYDMGTFNGDEPVDYPLFAKKVAEGIVEKRFDKGILICGTGIGMAIMANRFKEIRAANCHEIYTAKLAREHNDANVLTLGARVIAEELAKEIVDTFLKTPFLRDVDRYVKRVKDLSISFCTENKDK